MLAARAGDVLAFPVDVVAARTDGGCGCDEREQQRESE